MNAERGIIRIIWRCVLAGLAVALLPLSATGHERRIREGDDDKAFLLET